MEDEFLCPGCGETRDRIILMSWKMVGSRMLVRLPHGTMVLCEECSFKLSHLPDGARLCDDCNCTLLELADILRES